MPLRQASYTSFEEAMGAEPFMAHVSELGSIQPTELSAVRDQVGDETWRRKYNMNTVIRRQGTRSRRSFIERTYHHAGMNATSFRRGKKTVNSGRCLMRNGKLLLTSSSGGTSSSSVRRVSRNLQRGLVILRR